MPAHSGRPVHSISTAPPSAAVDSRERTRRYLVMMVIRTLCFLLMVIAGSAGYIWLALGFTIAAVLLPYPAVVIANNVDRRSTTAPVAAPNPLGLSDTDEVSRRSRTWDAPAG